MKVALIYDRVNKWGGAERILLALHEMFPDAPLYTAVYNKKKAKWANVFEIRTSFLQKLPFASSHNELLAPLMPLAFESFSLDDFDLVISVTSEAAKGIVTKPKTKHICYCLTPTRYLWSGYEEYFGNKASRFFSKPIVSQLRKWDQISAQRPDAFIAISEEVKGRIKKYYGRDSKLVYPPVTLTNVIARSEATKQSFQKRLPRSLQSLAMTGDYFLVVSRLSQFTKYKRIDLAIDAANKTRLPLKIVGDGNWREELEKKAGPTVEFLGGISDENLISYYKNCRALIFPGHEDLGLVMIEAQSFGKPVIAYNAGGAKELVIDPSVGSGRATGILFDEQTSDSLVHALQKFDKTGFDPQDCINNAEKFGLDKFKKNFLFVIERLI